MYGKRRKKIAEVTRPARYWEKLWMKRGALAGGVTASVISVACLAWYYPAAFAAAVMFVAFMLTVYYYAHTISRDIDFSGEYRE